jgi:hypothetical protein
VAWRNRFGSARLRIGGSSIRRAKACLMASPFSLSFLHPSSGCVDYRFALSPRISDSWSEPPSRGYGMVASFGATPKSPDGKFWSARAGFRASESLFQRHCSCLVERSSLRRSPYPPSEGGRNLERLVNEGACGKFNGIVSRRCTRESHAGTRRRGSLLAARDDLGSSAVRRYECVYCSPTGQTNERQTCPSGS